MHSNQPVAFSFPREDANSRLAHEQLVAKGELARSGAAWIDLYFLGDSITRRWGCTDPQWAELLEHWNRNFHGWNAANFGWGGDRIENIHWRIQNGELDGVNPKVIVILAGTNNVGDKPGDEAKIANILAGYDALLATCRAKAPGATILLTAIFPRNDSANQNDRRAVLNEIATINAELKKRADGKSIRYVNVNDWLASSEGDLFDGVALDGLHLSAKGYDIWAAGLRPVLEELLNRRGDIDLAPPPTGDPSAAASKRGS